MIKNENPLSMSEAAEYIGDNKEGSEIEVKKFVKKFGTVKPEEAKEMRSKLEGLDLIKMKQEYLVKVIDLLPENSENLNKIFTDVNLDEDETKKILDIVKEYK